MMPKFKAFLKDTNQVLDVEIIFFELGIVKLTNNKFYEFEDVFLMQSIGLHDKNGVEIFEGDVVKPRIGKPFVVKQFIYGQGVLKTALITSDWHGFDGIYHGSLVEVIGNICENPELLDDV